MTDLGNSMSITVMWNRLRTFQPENGQKFKNSKPQSKSTGSYKKKRVYCSFPLNDIFIIDIEYGTQSKTK